MEPTSPLTEQPIQTDTIPSEPQIVTAPTPSNIQENNSKVIIISVIVVLLVAAVGAAGYFLGASRSSISPPFPLTPNGEVGCTMEPQICPDGSIVGRSGPNCEFEECPSAEAFDSAISAPTDWQTYSNLDYGFSINYPNIVSGFEGKWEYVESPGNGDLTDTNVDWVGFRPSSIKVDTLWAVNIFTDITVDEVIAKLGDQFPDRKESRQNTIIGGKPAIIAKVSTPQNPEWLSKVVVITDNDKTYAIYGDQTPEFDIFYQSFKTLK